jgi:hypothetical protein
MYLTTPVVCQTLVKRRDSGRMPDFGLKTQLLSYARLRLEDVTLVIYLDSTRTSWLLSTSWLRSCITTLSMSMPHILQPHMWKTLHGRARWLQYFIAQTLSRKQTGRDAWLIQCSKPQHLTASYVQESGHVQCDKWTLSPTRSERNSSIQKDSVPPITWANQGLQMSG